MFPGIVHTGTFYSIWCAHWDFFRKPGNIPAEKKRFISFLKEMYRCIQWPDWKICLFNFFINNWSFPLIAWTNCILIVVNEVWKRFRIRTNRLHKKVTRVEIFFENRNWRDISWCKVSMAIYSLLTEVSSFWDFAMNSLGRVYEESLYQELDDIAFIFIVVL